MTQTTPEAHLATFLAALHGRRTLRLTHSGRRGETVRRVAPLDVGPSRIAGDTVVRFHFHDYDATRGPKLASLTPGEILGLEPDGGTFDPADIVTWPVADSPWRVPRDWGASGHPPAGHPSG